MFRQALQIKRLDVRHRSGALQAGDAGYGRVTSHVYEYPLAS